MTTLVTDMTAEGQLGDFEAVDLNLYWPAKPRHAQAPIADSAEAAALLAPVLAEADVQRCALIYLDAAHRPVGTELLAVGTVDRVIVDAWLIFSRALTEGAVSIVVGQSHPSGDAEPTADDVRLVRALQDAGQLVRVALRDYVILGGGRWVSALSRLPGVIPWQVGAPPEGEDPTTAPGLE